MASKISPVSLDGSYSNYKEDPIRSKGKSKTSLIAPTFLNGNYSPWDTSNPNNFAGSHIASNVTSEDLNKYTGYSLIAKNVTAEDLGNMSPMPLIYIPGKDTNTLPKMMQGYYTQTTNNPNMYGSVMMSNGIDSTVDLNWTNATEDYKKKVKGFGKKVANTYADADAQREEYATSANNKDDQQVNSTVDILASLFRDGPGAALANTKDYVTNMVIKPIVNVEPVKLLFNGLNNIGEVADYITGTAAVKAIAQSDAGPSALADLVGLGAIQDTVDVVRSFIDPTYNAEAKWIEAGTNLRDAYLGTNGGRKNFDWDTGNMWGDMALEVLSDPTTYTGIGSAVSLGVASSKAGRSVVKSAVKEASVDLSQETLNKASHTLTHAFKNVSTLDHSVEDLAQNATKKIMRSDDMMQLIQKEAKDAVKNIDAVKEAALYSSKYDIALKQITQTHTINMYNSVKTAVNLQENASVINRLDSLRGLRKTLDVVDNKVMQAAFRGTGLAVGMDTIKGVRKLAQKGSAGVSHVLNKLNTKLEGTPANLSTLEARMKDISDTFTTLDIAKQEDTTAIQSAYKTAQIQRTGTETASNLLSIIEDNKASDLNILFYTDNWALRASNKECTSASAYIDTLLPYLDGNSVTHEALTNIQSNLDNIYNKRMLNTLYDVKSVLDDFRNANKATLGLHDVAKHASDRHASQQLYEALKTVRSQNTAAVNKVCAILSASPELTHSKAISNGLRNIVDLTQNASVSGVLENQRLFGAEFEARINTLRNAIKDHIGETSAKLFGDKENAISYELGTVAQRLDNTTKTIDALKTKLGDVLQDGSTYTLGTKEITHGKVYDLKLSEVYTARKYYSDPVIQRCMNALMEEHYGQLSDTVKRWADSSKMYNSTLARVSAIPDEVIPKDLKRAIADVLSSPDMRDVYKIDNLEDFTTNVMSRAKKFLDSTNQVLDFHLDYKFNTPNTTTNVRNMLQAMKQVRKYSDLRTAYKEAAKDDRLNLLFSCARDIDGIYEVTFHHPERGLITFKRKGAVHLSDALAKSQFYQDSKTATSVLHHTTRRTSAKVVNLERADLIPAVASFLKDVQHEGHLAGDKSVRLLGFNSSKEAFGQAAILNDAFKTNRAHSWVRDEFGLKVDTYTTTHCDLGQLINAKHGAVVVQDKSFDALTSALKRTQAALNDRVKLVKLNGVEAISPNGADVTLLPRIKVADFIAQLKLLPFQDDNITELIKRFSSIFGQIKDEMGDLENILLDVDRLDNTNIMREINSVYDDAGIQPLALRTVIDKDRVFSLLGAQDAEKISFVHQGGKVVFDKQQAVELQKIFNYLDDCEINTYSIKALEQYSNKFAVDDIYNLITDKLQKGNVVLDTNMLKPNIARAYEDLRQKLISEGNERVANTIASEKILQALNNKLYILSICDAHLDELHKIYAAQYAVDLLSEVFEQKTCGKLLWSLGIDLKKDLPGIVFSGKAYYHPDIKYLDSMYLQDDSTINSLFKMQQAITKETQGMTDLIEKLRKRMLLEEQQGMHTAESQIMYNAITEYTAYINTFKDTIRKAQVDYKVSKGANEFKARHIYNKAASKITDHLDVMKRANAQYRIETLSDMAPEEYTMFLYKYALGKQIINTNAELFSSSKFNDMFIKLKDNLELAKQYGVHFKEFPEENRILIWLDKHITENLAFVEVCKAYNLEQKVTQKANTPTGKYLDLMDRVTNNAFRISNYTAFTDYNFKEVRDFFESHGVHTSIPWEHYVSECMTSHVYNQTIIGDFGTDIGTIFKNASPNPLSCIASGFEHTYNFMATKENFSILLFNYESSLEYYKTEALKQVGQDIGAEYEVLYDAFKLNDMVLCRLDQESGMVSQVHLAEHRISAIHQLKKLDEQGGCFALPYTVYTTAVEHLNDNNIHSNVYKFINQHYLAPMKIMQLARSGWLINNMRDSAIKGALETGDIPMFFSKLPETHRIRIKFQNTLNKMYAYTEGNMTKSKVNEFFAAHLDDNTILNRRVFNDLYEFVSSSASSPTAVQLELESNLHKKLQHYIKEIDGATEADLNKVIKYFNDNPDMPVNEFIRNIIKSYPVTEHEKAVKLARLRTQMKEPYKVAPFQRVVMENKFSPIHWLFRGNDAFETFIRTHVQLMNTDYLGASKSAAYKATDFSQFNRARDSVARKLADQLFPFSSFAVDNLIFYLKHLDSDSVLQKYLEHCAPTLVNEYDANERENNLSLQYMLINGNIPIGNTGLDIKVNDSFYGALQFLANPVGQMASMLHVSVKSTGTIINLMRDCDEKGLSLSGYFEKLDQLDKQSYESAYNVSRGWVHKDETLGALLNLVPLVGTMWTRYVMPIKKTNMADNILPAIFPNIFNKENLYVEGAGWSDDKFNNMMINLPGVSSLIGIVKPSYKDLKPVGLDWYQQDAEYRRTHTYVPGVSYVPTFIFKDPARYVDTFGRLQAMGYSKEEASQMMQRGWYIRNKSFILDNWIARSEYLYRTEDGQLHSAYYKDVDDLRKQGYNVYTNDAALPFWMRVRDKDQKVYLRTKQSLNELGYSDAEALQLMIEGWYVAANGELVDRGEQNELDANAFKRLQLFQQGKAPFPTDYVSAKNRTNIYGDGLSWEQSFVKQYGRKPSEMWLNPTTGDVYFQNQEGNNYNATNYQPAVQNTYKKKVYVPYAHKFNINKYSPIKYKRGVITPMKIDSVTYSEHRAIRKDVFFDHKPGKAMTPRHTYTKNGAYAMYRAGKIKYASSQGLARYYRMLAQARSML